ncbi:hypothetical protein NDI42_23375 [Funiculus sociatus GB2-C1]|uniref:hypothetical protein n=1 Tax=Trichocoleus sp. FACHB-69 TaxID=2692874 RepID=UPI0016882F04|nr:hypothetical protein [Trichocoleus sp. FACHB-69]
MRFVDDDPVLEQPTYDGRPVAHASGTIHTRVKAKAAGYITQCLRAGVPAVRCPLG